MEYRNVPVRTRNTLRAVSSVVLKLLSDNPDVGGSFKKEYAIQNCKWVLNFVRTGDGTAIVSLECWYFNSQYYWHGNTTGKPGHFSRSRSGWKEVLGTVPVLLARLNKEFSFIPIAVGF